MRTLCSLILVAGPCFAQEPKLADPQLTAEKLFDPAHLVRVEVELAKADWDALRVQTRTFAGALGKKPAQRPFVYYKGHVTIDGVRIENVGVRKKGFIGSLDNKRPSLKIKFDEFVDQAPAAGFDRLTLNNNKQDRSLVSQSLTYRLYREAGAPASRCNHAVVTVNGESLGIYSNVESIEAPFLRRAFGDDSGDLYEGTVADLFADTLAKFEFKTDTTEIGPLRRAAAALAEDPVDLDELDRVVDVDAFLTFWAIESLTGFWDGYANNQNNYFVYRKPANAKLYFVPWGTDASFENRMPIPPYFIKPKSVHSQALLANRLYRLPAIQRKYKQRLEGLLARVWNEEKLYAELDRVEALVADHLHATQRDFARAVKRVRSFVKNRRKILQRELDTWPVELKSGPRRPFYFRPIGTATASFSTTWSKRASAKPLTNDKAELELVLDGKPVAFEQIGVSAAPSTWPTMDGSQPPPTIVFTFKRKSDGKRLTLALSVSAEEFRATDGKLVPAQGAFLDGQGFMGRDGFKMISGQVRLDAAAMQEGEAVRGEAEVQILEMAGGAFGERR